MHTKGHDANDHLPIKGHKAGNAGDQSRNEGINL